MKTTLEPATLRSTTPPATTPRPLGPPSAAPGASQSGARGPGATIHDAFGGGVPFASASVALSTPSSTAGGTNAIQARVTALSSAVPEAAAASTLVSAEEQQALLVAAATWIDDNLGNGDGTISTAELQAFTDKFGHDPVQHWSIQNLAKKFGVPTTEQGGTVQLVRAPGDDVKLLVKTLRVETRPLPPDPATSANPADAYSIARRLIRTTSTALAATVDETLDGLAALPLTVLQLLERRGTVVVVTGRIIDYRPDWTGMQPRGWPPGTTWADPTAMHDRVRNEVAIATGGSTPRIVAHEVGHALDVALPPSRSVGATFARLYRLDHQRLTQAGEQYLLQPGNAGPSEAFAESFGRFAIVPEALRSAFPNLFSYWQWVEKNGFEEVGA